MYGTHKRKITFSLMVLAGLAVVVALSLAGPGERAVASVPDPAADPSPSDPGPVVAPQPPAPIPPQPPRTAERPKVDLVFALDTTGSMSGLIEGAKRKIWSIANQILAGQPRPDLRIGLVGYRDMGDDYVTRRFPLSEDIEDVYANLQGFRAGGGGDTPEHVNRALSDALHHMRWREGQEVLRLVFLVGDAPPHEGRQGLYSSQLAREAGRRGIVINAVRCGGNPDTAVAWRQIANGAGGMYASIQQDGGMVALSTPVDRRLGELNARLSATILPAGTAEDKAEVGRRARINAALGGIASAESARFRAKSGKLDRNDLLTQIKRGRKLEEMRDEELPEAVAKLPAPARQAYVAKVAQQRAELKNEIDKLAKEREGYIRAAKPKSMGAPAFDDVIGSALKAQGKRAGIAY